MGELNIFQYLYRYWFIVVKITFFQAIKSYY